jgi:polyisoprenyl-phosphate glycosyltransferase
MSDFPKPLPQINIVAPLYNEEESFPILVERLTQLLDSTKLTVEVILVDDGSRDRTRELMEAQSLKDPRFQSVVLSRNHGHQLALSAGLSLVTATEAVLVIDGDLQDPPELLDTFYDYYQKGYEVIYGVRRMRKDEGFVKRTTSFLFYRFMRQISSYDIPFDSGDFSLISRRVADKLSQMPERARFIRGMRAYLGYKQIGVEFERQERQAGETKYPMRKMIKLALDAIFSFSDLPYRLMLNAGTVLMLSALAYLVIAIIKKLTGGEVESGFTAIITLMFLFSGFTIFALGILGGYIVRTFNQVISRPNFIVDYTIFRGEKKRA